MVGVWGWHFRYTSSEAYVGEAVMKAACDAKKKKKEKNKKQAAVCRAVDRGLEMLHNSESIQIKWLFRMERAISLTLDFNYLSLPRHFNDIVGDFWDNKISYF